MNNKNKKLLIVGSGVVRGAYGASVLTKLHQEFGADYFDDILACSVSSYSASYYVAGQVREMEYAWRNLLSDKKFVRTGKKLKRGQVLNLGYLYQLMTKGNLKLNVDKIFKSKTNIKYVLTEYKTGKVVYISPQKDNIFKLITGSSALLPFYRPVKINNKEYIDGALGGEPTPFNMKFIEKYDKILIIQNVNYKEKIIVATLKMLTFLTPKKIDKIIDHYLKNIKDIERARKHENVFLLTPSKTMPLKSRFDTNKKRINATFDLGIEDAKRAIEFLRK